MKHTLYILLSLGSVACANALDTSTTVTDGNPITLSMDVSYFSVTVALDAEAIAADLATDEATGNTELFSVTVNDKELGFGLVDEGTAPLQLYTPTKSAGLQPLAWDTTAYPAAPANTIWENVEKAVLTVVYPFGESMMGIIPPTNALAQFTLQLHDGSFINYEANGVIGATESPLSLTSFGINSDYVLQGWIQEVDGAKAVKDFRPTLNAINEKAIEIAPGSSDSIPEPTTATLSLLALTGLAARRRRK